VLRAPGDDALRQCRTDAWQTRDLAHVGAIEIDALAGKERTGELCGLASGLAQTGRTRRGTRLELDVAGSSRGSRRENEANTGAREREAGEHEGGAAVIHEWMVLGSDERPVTEKMRRSNGKGAVKKKRRRSTAAVAS
jgi:hypothetical protein